MTWILMYLTSLSSVIGIYHRRLWVKWLVRRVGNAFSRAWLYSNTINTLYKGYTHTNARTHTCSNNKNVGREDEVIVLLPWKWNTHTKTRKTKNKQNNKCKYNKARLRLKDQKLKSITKSKMGTTRTKQAPKLRKIKINIAKRLG